MRQPGGERRSIEERVWFLSLGEFELALERPNFAPPFQQTLLFLREIDLRHLEIQPNADKCGRLLFTILDIYD